MEVWAFGMAGSNDDIIPRAGHARSHRTAGNAIHNSCGVLIPGSRDLRVGKVMARRRSEDLDGRGGSGDELLSRLAIECDPDGNALGQPYPVEGRVYVG